MLAARSYKVTCEKLSVSQICSQGSVILLVEFHIIVCGLDSIFARRWMNGMVVRASTAFFSLLLFQPFLSRCFSFFSQLSLLRYKEDGQLDHSSIVPIVDGGTEGFKGHARVIFPGITACMDCTMDLYPPQVGIFRGRGRHAQRVCVDSGRYGLCVWVVRSDPFLCKWVWLIFRRLFLI